MLIGHVTNMRRLLPGRQRSGSGVLRAGLNMLLKKNTTYEERLKQLADSGVTLSACQNAMRFLNVKTEDCSRSRSKWIRALPNWRANRKRAGLHSLN